jgi:hypothetical protein
MNPILPNKCKKKLNLNFFILDKEINRIFRKDNKPKPFCLIYKSSSMFFVIKYRKNIKIQTLLKKLHALFIHHKIPEFYSYYFLKRLILAQ